MNVDFFDSVMRQVFNRFLDGALDIPRQLRNLHAEKDDQIEIDAQSGFVAGHLHADKVRILRADDARQIPAQRVTQSIDTRYAKRRFHRGQTDDLLRNLVNIHFAGLIAAGLWHGSPPFIQSEFYFICSAFAIAVASTLYQKTLAFSILFHESARVFFGLFFCFY